MTVAQPTCTGRRWSRRLALTVAAATALSVGAATGPAQAEPGGEAGAVFAVESLPADRMPNAGDSRLFTYRTLGADHKPHLATATLFEPEGAAPAGGWPVIAWVHGSRGLAEKCRPSAHPTAVDNRTVREWLDRGYAVVSPDFAGLGSADEPQFFDVTAAGRNVVDAVRAAHDISGDLSDDWAVIGEQGGASAATQIARKAEQWQGRELNFVGGAATSVPAYFDQLVTSVGHDTAVVEFAVPPAVTADVLYTLAAIDDADIGIDLDDHLSPTGRSWVDRAKQTCAADLTKQVAPVALGELGTTPIDTNRGLTALIDRSLSVPVDGFKHPMLLTQTLSDDSVVLPNALRYLAEVYLGNSQVTVQTFPTLDEGQAGAMADSSTQRFVSGLFR